ncbi:CDK-activating kinase assembly factor MAT1 isoform X2 [Conger conger]|nr:CDK-activating kinase assembly factor MAT1 isoform X2 [Conger conger]XP_061089500.1 CDK-activating kinase assembly factor MAT1 isoform X2 [Conger conger]
MLFVRGSGNCVQCDTPLRKSNFRVQLFEDPAVDKEVEIRKKVLKIYNKRDTDFPSLKEYNDYLEQVEELVFNLTNNMDVENTKQIMEQYQRENREIIQKNKVKLTREQEELEELLLLEQQGSEQRRLETLQEEQRQLLAKRKNKQALLDELESSQLPATLLLAQHKDRAAQLETQLEKQRQIVKPTIFSTGIPMGQTISLQPVVRMEEVLYQYQPLFIHTYGPPVPELEQLGRLGYLNHVRAASPQDTAGGYTSALACHRAVQDAFSGLLPTLH